MMMRLFDELNIETQSTCNRVCASCLRQSYPERAALAGRKAAHKMPAQKVYTLLDQAAEMGFRGYVCLQHFNEPLQDERIARFGHHAKSKGVFKEVYLNTNGDYLTPQKALELDGAFDHLNIALYSGDKARRAAQYTDWFRKTRLTFTMGEHIVTHHSPFVNLADEIVKAAGQPCERECQMRCIIGYDGKMLLCCEDIAGVYDLGNAHTTSLRDLWFGDRHAEILDTLSRAGGRASFPYCAICPRTNTPWWTLGEA